MTDQATYTVVGPEAQTRKLFDELRKTQKDADQQGNLLVEKVFVAMYYASLPASQVEAVAKAMHNLHTCDLRATLTRLVRAKVLRSSSHRGATHYEVNY